MWRQLGMVTALSSVLAAAAEWAAADPITMTCAIERVRVSAENATDAQLACAVAETTDVSLRALGLWIDVPIRIDVMDKLDIAADACIAFYSTDAHRVQVLAVDCLDDQPGRAKAFPNMDAHLLFESVIVHELVHAYVDQTSSARALDRLTHEYLAYAVQIDALPAPERARILARAGVTGPVAFDARADDRDGGSGGTPACAGRDGRTRLRPAAGCPAVPGPGRPGRPP